MAPVAPVAPMGLSFADFANEDIHYDSDDEMEQDP